MNTLPKAKKGDTPFRKWRIKKGLTMDAVARALDVSTSTVQKWEYIEREPARLYAKAIAEVYPDCPLAFKA